MTELEVIAPDVYSRLACNSQPLSTRPFRTHRIFVWYDYFCCPQLDDKSSGHLGEDDELSKAVGSIPAYVGRCEFFLALCPVVEAKCLSKVISYDTWSQRGWCRVELEMRKLSCDHTWIMIKNGRMLEAIATLGGSIGGSPGEGQFLGYC